MMENGTMTDENTSAAGTRPSTRHRQLSARRVALLASAASLGIAVVLAGPGVYRGMTLPTFSSPAYAEAVQHPVGFADIVAKVKPAVISVRVKLDEGQKFGLSSGNDELPFPPNSPMERFFRQFGFPETPQQHQYVTGQGSGFFISADGYAVTNNHVVDHATSVRVTTDDGKTYTARVIGTDPKTDLALIKIDGHNDFPFVKFADQSPRIGDWIVAVGNPFGLSETVTAGIVSARGRDIGAGPYDDFIQIDAPINKGNSGGPSFNVDGNVVGVNTAIVSPSGGSVGIGFAIPADTVKMVVAQLKDKGYVTRGWIGVQIQKVTPDIAESLGLKKAEGALVAEPQPDSPATKAGIQSGDVITALNGREVKDSHDLARKVAETAPGTSVKLTILHNGAQKTIELTLGEMPKTQEAKTATHNGEMPGVDLPRLGLSLAPAGEVAGAGSQGVTVTAVDPDGTAADHGLQTGDVILDVGGKAVSTPSDVRKALHEVRTEGKRAVLMRVKSGEMTKFVALPLGHTG
jgi:serine protease Do